MWANEYPDVLAFAKASETNESSTKGKGEEIPAEGSENAEEDHNKGGDDPDRINDRPFGRGNNGEETVKIWGKMFIISNVSASEDVGLTAGHAWIRLEGNDGTITTITELQYQKISSFNSTSDNVNWTMFNTCAGYSANLCNYITRR